MKADTERTVVKFLVAALGQGRERARQFARTVPGPLQPQLMAAAQAWLQKSCMEASTQFTALMAMTTPRPQALEMSTANEAPVRKRKRVVWTPEMRKKASLRAKRQFRKLRQAATPPQGAGAEGF